MLTLLTVEPLTVILDITLDLIVAPLNNSHLECPFLGVHGLEMTNLIGLAT